MIVTITEKLEKPSRSVLLWLHATTHNQTLNLLFHRWFGLIYAYFFNEL